MWNLFYSWRAYKTPLALRPRRATLPNHNGSLNRKKSIHPEILPPALLISAKDYRAAGRSKSQPNRSRIVILPLGGSFGGCGSATRCTSRVLERARLDLESIHQPHAKTSRAKQKQSSSSASGPFQDSAFVLSSSERFVYVTATRQKRGDEIPCAVLESPCAPPSFQHAARLPHQSASSRSDRRFEVTDERTTTAREWHCCLGFEEVRWWNEQEG